MQVLVAENSHDVSDRISRRADLEKQNFICLEEFIIDVTGLICWRKF